MESKNKDVDVIVKKSLEQLEKERELKKEIRKDNALKQKRIKERNKKLIEGILIGTAIATGASIAVGMHKHNQKVSDIVSKYDSLDHTFDINITDSSNGLVVYAYDNINDNTNVVDLDDAMDYVVFDALNSGFEKVEDREYLLEGKFNKTAMKTYKAENPDLEVEFFDVDTLRESEGRGR